MKTKILYVDNDAGWRRLVGLFLKLAGFQVLTAVDAVDALRQALTEPLGAIILEANADGEDEAEFISYLKANKPEVPVIVYTDRENGAASIKRLLDRGAVQCLRKGNLKDLVKCVEDRLRKLAPASLPALQPLLQPGGWQMA